MTRSARRLIVRLLGTLVLIGTVGMLALVAFAALGVDRAAKDVGELTYTVTGVGYVHRQVQKMEVASFDSSDPVEGVRLNRALVAQQLRATLAGLTLRPEPNPNVPMFTDALAALDRRLATAPSSVEQLRADIAHLEVVTKQMYDVEQQRYFELTNRAMESKRRSQQLLILVAVAIGLLGIGFYIAVRRSARIDLRAKAEELGEANRTLERAQADRARLLERAIAAGERERTRLAAELHDGPIQHLAAVGVAVGRAKLRIGRGDASAAAPIVSHIEQDVADLVAQLRRLMSELRPPVLDEGGLGAAVADLANTTAERTGIACNLACDVDDAPIPPEVETVLYRVAQEALLNVARHSDASNFWVSLGETDGVVRLEVRDDGVGFDLARRGEFVRNDHFGLAGMRERIEMAGGRFDTSSTAGTGTSIVATIDLADRPDAAMLTDA